MYTDAYTDLKDPDPEVYRYVYRYQISTPLDPRMESPTKLNGGRYTDVYTDLKDLDPDIRIYRSQRSTPHRTTIRICIDLKNKKYHIMHAVNLAYMHRKTLILFIPRIARGEWVGQ